ncbi:aspartate aminotransferase family protein [Xinfangfangia sp. D13-10-4-6]|uniref:aspartate aminotransferase family protein n=1 Tax=Pseudogemmobacter hezensis TaxID=2737662 RepID=UPI001557B3DD|nr:aspartate aminotransferase family protein [Pseudogemmobacter hezensis]NPD14308.1 aspartate aminotransferase family protein [Pseudogemmobacter hezensis]
MTRGTMVNAFDRATAQLSPADDALVSRREAALGPAYRLFYETPVHLVRGEGVWLYDADGNPWLDCYNNVASVGHCHPRVVEAMAKQASTLATHTRYLHEGILDYAERLLGYFPPALSHVMFTCTGSEANDLAYRIARAATGGTGVIVTSNAYHGVTLATAEMSMSIGPAVAPGANVFPVPAPTLANYPGGVAAGFSQAIRDACAKMREQGIRPAMLIVDTIFSSDGLITGPEGFLKDAADAIRAEGGLFLADEVQPGFARTGAAMWGFQRHGVVPDMVSMGKPMGNGYPVAALVMRPEVIADFGAKARYFNTYGGNAVAAAVAGAVLSVIEDERLLDNARASGAALLAGLDDLATKHPALGERRGAGLFVAVDILEDGQPSAEAAARVVNRLRDARVLISASGAKGDALKIRPPLPFGADHAERFIETLDKVLAQ